MIGWRLQSETLNHYLGLSFGQILNRFNELIQSKIKDSCQLRYFYQSCKLPDDIGVMEQQKARRVISF